MPFTGPQRTAIYGYLGWAPRYIGLDSRMEAAITAIGADADACALAVAHLADLATIDARLAKARGRQAVASIDKNDVVFAGYRELLAHRSEGRRVVGRLAALLGCSARHDVFASSSSVDTGPELSPLQGPSGGYFKLG